MKSLATLLAAAITAGCASTTIPIEDGVEAAVKILNGFSSDKLDNQNFLMPNEVVIQFVLTKEDDGSVELLANNGDLKLPFGRTTVSGNTVTVTFKSIAFEDKDKSVIQTVEGAKALVKAAEHLKSVGGAVSR